MSDGEEPVVEPTLTSLQADVRALATAVAQLTARDRVVDGEGAHGSGSGQRFAGQPTGSGGAAERPDLLELAQSGHVGAKSVSAEDDYLAVPELLQRAESGYEAVRPVSRVPGLFPLSTDLTNEYLKQDDRRLPAQEEYLWMSCFGAHMAALFVALDELLPYVPTTNQDFTPYLARARNHAEAIDKAFRFRLAFLRRLNEIKRVHGDQGVLDRLQLQAAGVGEDVVADVDAVAKVSTNDGVGRRSSELQEPCEATFRSLSAQTLKSYAGRLSQFAEFCHDSENISPLEATTATVVRYVAWIGERGHIAAKSLQPYLSAINTFFELHNLVPIAKDSLHLTSARRGLMLRQRRLDVAPLRVPLPADVAYRFVSKAELIVSAPYPESHLDYRALLASVVNFLFFARGLTGVSCRAQDVHVDTYNITLQYDHFLNDAHGSDSYAAEMREAWGRLQAATAGHIGDADARQMEREVDDASGSQKELTAFLDQANNSRLRNEVCALPATCRERILFNQLDAASGMWTVAIPTARTAMTPHELREVAAGYFLLPSPCVAPVVGSQIILPSTEHNPVTVDLYGDALMNLPAPGDAHWRVQHDAIADAFRDHCVHDLGIAVRREVDDLFQQAVPLGNTVPRDELKDLVPDAELSLPAFNVVTGSYDPRSLKSTLLEFKTMRYGSITLRCPGPRLWIGLSAPCWATYNMGLSARDAAWHNTEPGQKGPLRDILDMSEYTGMVFGTVGRISCVVFKEPLRHGIYQEGLSVRG
eukprot:jgi/Tetstr1/441354/TSEL_029605.t1